MLDVNHVPNAMAMGNVKETAQERGMENVLAIRATKETDVWNVIIIGMNLSAMRPNCCVAFVMWPVAVTVDVRRPVQRAVGYVGQDGRCNRNWADVLMWTNVPTGNIVVGKINFASTMKVHLLVWVKQRRCF